MENQERYEIRRKLGQGGVGAVYEGYDHQLRRRVAVKRLLQSEEEQSEKAVKELLKECHSLSALNSPNIVQLFDFGEDGDGPFVVMELLDGQTLDDLISRAPFTEEDFLILAEQSLEGLLAAHQAHLLHRDLKPCNFMVTWLPSGRMQLKLLDFGLAKFSVEPSKQTIAHGNSLFGSIYFMAPEQFEQLPLDPRTDLYALGAVFYYALAGTYPFNGESVAQVMASHLTGQYKDLRHYRPDLNPLLCKWVMSLISRRPDDRPATCAITLAQFTGMQDGSFVPPEPIRVEPPAAQPSGDVGGEAAAHETKKVMLKLPGAERNTGPVRLQTGRVTAKASPPPPPPPHAPNVGGAQAVPLSERPSEHTGAVHAKAGSSGASRSVSPPVSKPGPGPGPSGISAPSPAAASAAAASPLPAERMVERPVLPQKPSPAKPGLPQGSASKPALPSLPACDPSRVPRDPFAPRFGSTSVPEEEKSKLPLYFALGLVFVAVGLGVFYYYTQFH